METEGVKPWEQMTEVEKAERAFILQRLRYLSEMYYSEAQSIGWHFAIEINGLLVQLIKVAERMHEKGLDFMMNSPRLETEDAHYIGEKLGCIWGGVLGDAGLRTALLSGMLELPPGAVNKISFRMELPEPEEGAPEASG